MADLQTALRTRLLADPAIAAAIGDRAWWMKVKQGAVLPYMRLQTISDPRPRHLRGYEGARSPRVRVEVFADSYEQARALSERVVAVMAQPATHAGVRFGAAAAQGPVDLGEDTPNGFIHRLSTDLLAEHSII
ncbi:tail completion protein gp17 [Aurantiacibacter luteus]|uniref:tail completion protein gp17 n=1 Tax=Aurantiacibacter luteus TaxID=1581420 RepID=UPI00069B45EE|nr:DUF3168 domain-containing protein [Aurantiacibacter luteus]